MEQQSNGAVEQWSSGANTSYKGRRRTKIWPSLVLARTIMSPRKLSSSSSSSKVVKSMGGSKRTKRSIEVSPLPSSSSSSFPEIASVSPVSSIQKVEETLVKVEEDVMDPVVQQQQLQPLQQEKKKTKKKKTTLKKTIKKLKRKLAKVVPPRKPISWKRKSNTDNLDRVLRWWSLTGKAGIRLTYVGETVNVLITALEEYEQPVAASKDQVMFNETEWFLTVDNWSKIRGIVESKDGGIVRFSTPENVQLHFEMENDFLKIVKYGYEEMEEEDVEFDVEYKQHDLQLTRISSFQFLMLDDQLSAIHEHFKKLVRNKEALELCYLVIASFIRKLMGEVVVVPYIHSVEFHRLYNGAVEHISIWGLLKPIITYFCIEQKKRSIATELNVGSIYFTVINQAAYIQKNYIDRPYEDIVNLAKISKQQQQ